MKKNWILLLLALAWACTPTKKESFTLTGQVAGLDEAVVYLQDRIAGQFISIDTTMMTAGVFVFEGTQAAPELLYVKVEGIGPLFQVFLENGQIVMEINAEDPSAYKVSGSASHNILETFMEQVKKFDADMRLKQQQYVEANVMGNEVLATSLQAEYEALDAAKKEIVWNTVRTHNKTAVGAYIAMRNLTYGMDYVQMSELLNTFDPSLAGTRYYEDIKARIAILERTAIGKPAVDFTLENTEGEMISLSDFKGKYVFIDFWASWCPYCRDENPHLVKVYEMYGGAQFEMLGVSLDRNKEAWIKGIKEDGLKWPQVSDLLGWNSGPAAEYAIKNIPQNVLVDPNGIIIDRNLKGEKLEQRLEALLRPV